MHTKKLYKHLILIFTIVLIDQLTKGFVNQNSDLLIQTVNIFPFLNFVFVTNRGVSFGLLSGLDITLYLGIISIIISILLFRWLINSKDLVEAFGISLIIAGAIGNGIDRIIDGYVIDFIDIYYKSFHWPSFNIADSSITLGVVAYFYRNLKLKAK